jgi:hypothetical protein
MCTPLALTRMRPDSGSRSKLSGGLKPIPARN